MPIRVVRLGGPRIDGEGLRLGTVRRPPRGVPKFEYSSRDFFDVWLPDLAPSAALVKIAHAAVSEAQWRSFSRRYRAELGRPEKRRLLDLLAALSHSASFSVGCTCADASRCHRSLLRELLAERGAAIE